MSGVAPELARAVHPDRPALPTKPAGLRVVAIAAMAENRAIGSGNTLPWNLPDDMKWFRQSTRGKTLLMGRKTFESIGRPLPNRRTIVLTRSAWSAAGVEVCDDLNRISGLLNGTNELWICGGAEVYTLTLPWWDELLLTRVKRPVDGDAFFPSFEDRLAFKETIVDTSELVIERHVRRPSVASV